MRLLIYNVYYHSDSSVINFLISRIWPMSLSHIFSFVLFFSVEELTAMRYLVTEKHCNSTWINLFNCVVIRKAC